MASPAPLRKVVDPRDARELLDLNDRLLEVIRELRRELAEARARIRLLEDKPVVTPDLAQCRSCGQDVPVDLVSPVNGRCWKCRSSKRKPLR
jgi:predicted Zn-ribbon and HTH transcriptional regulator